MSPTSGATASVEAALAFVRPGDALPDERRPGLLRARPIDVGLARPEDFDFRTCRFHDLAAPGALRPDLLANGFAHADLSLLPELQAALERVRVTGQLGPPEERAVRRGLLGRTLPLGDGRRIRVLFIAGEGLILRKAGPDGLPARRSGGARGGGADPKLHPGAAVNVHADQDVGGTPIRQMLRGAAPWLFRHEAPHSANRRSRLLLLNLWIPLQQVTRPLALMDCRSLDRRRHQLRFELPTDGFLQREEDRRINDIWSFLHDDGQRWYFSSEMDARRAYVFDTLGTPHGAFSIPGEAVARDRVQRLERALVALDAGDRSGLLEATTLAPVAGPAPGTVALQRAVGVMEALLAEAAAEDSRIPGAAAADWRLRAKEAIDRVIRKSIELRMVALLWPRVRRPGGERPGPR